MLKAIFNGKTYDIINMRTFGYNRYIFDLSSRTSAYCTVKSTVIGFAKIKRHKIYIIEDNYGRF